MDIDPEWKMIRRDLGRIEKWVLRNAFDDEKPYLPKRILYRQKEQFSDNVGYSWIDGLKDHANEHVSDSMMMNASFVYPENTPQQKKPTIIGRYSRNSFPRMLPGQRYQEVLVWRAALLKLLNGMQPGPKTLIRLAVLLSVFMMLRMKLLRKLLPPADPVSDNGFRPAHGESLVKTVASATAV